MRKNYRVRIEQDGKTTEFGVACYSHGMTFRPSALAFRPSDFKITCDTAYRKGEVIWHEIDGRLAA